MNVIELEGNLAVPQISFVPNTQHLPPPPPAPLPGAPHPALLALPRVPPEEGSSPLHLTHLCRSPCDSAGSTCDHLPASSSWARAPVR